MAEVKAGGCGGQQMDLFQGNLYFGHALTGMAAALSLWHSSPSTGRELCRAAVDGRVYVIVQRREAVYTALLTPLLLL